MDRQQGMTTNQMLDAPLDAIYIWVNSHLCYPRSLARSLNRPDLKIVSPEWLVPSSSLAARGKSVVIDHATWLTADQSFHLRIIRLRGIEVIRH